MTNKMLVKKAKSYYRLGVMHNKKGNKHKANYCFFKYQQIIELLNKEWELEK